MENILTFNREVNVAAYYFRGRDGRLDCFPKKIEFEGRGVNFAENGLRQTTKRDGRVIQVFDMTDGQADYRLEFDPRSFNWTLVSIADMRYAPAGVKPAFAA